MRVFLFFRIKYLYLCKEKNMAQLDLFKKMLSKAKSNGYNGSDYNYEIGRILDGTNYYAIVFREDFAKAVWGEEVSFYLFDKIHITGENLPKWKWHLRGLVNSENKWEYLKNNIDL